MAAPDAFGRIPGVNTDLQSARHIYVIHRKDRSWSRHVVPKVVRNFLDNLLSLRDYLSRITRFYTVQPKIFLGEDPQPPLPNTYTIISKLPWHLSVYVERGFNCTKYHALPKINLYVNIKIKNVIVCKVDLKHSSSEGKEPSVCFQFHSSIFFLPVKIFGKFDPPLAKIPGSAPVSGLLNG